MAQHARIRPRAARMSRTDATVAADHHPRLAVKHADVRFFHRVTNDTRATVAHDLHVELNRTSLFLLCDLVHGFELVLGIRTATDDRDIRRSTDVRETTRNV